MTTVLSVFLAIGESWEDFEKKGQAQLLLRNNISFYRRAFKQVFVFSYGQKSGELLPNVELIPNRFQLHRYIYAILLPFLNREKLQKSDVYRGMQLSGALPGLIAKYFYHKRLFVNYGYDYGELTRIEGKPVRAFLYKLLEKILLPKLDGTIVTTQSLRQKLSRSGLTQIHLIPNSVDTKLFKPLKGIQPDIDVLYVGRLEPQKNLQLLIRAVAEIRTVSLRVVFIGAGSQKRMLEELGRKLHVELLIFSNIAHDQLVNFYNRAKIFILPSVIEGHPKALLEAMSCEVAVVGSKIAGITDVVTSNYDGIVVDPQVGYLSNTIKKLMQNPKLRRRLGKKARKTILKHYLNESLWLREIRILKGAT